MVFPLGPDVCMLSVLLFMFISIEIKKSANEAGTNLRSIRPNYGRKLFKSNIIIRPHNLTWMSPDMILMGIGIDHNHLPNDAPGILL